MLAESPVRIEMLRALFAKLSGYGELPAVDQQRLHAAAGHMQSAPKGQDLVVQGTSPTTSFLILNGIAGRYTLSADGQRQIVSLLVPGDFADLPSLFLKPIDHSIACLTACEVVHFPHRDLLASIEAFGPLTAMLWRNTLVDGAIARKWLAATAFLSAEGRTAHLVCEMYLRLERVGLADGLRMSLPLSQLELSDVLGMSSVHMNRTIQGLRDGGLLTWQGGEVTIQDWDGLAEVGQFDPSYLGWGAELKPRARGPVARPVGDAAVSGGLTAASR
ncbi:MAG TPA: Crp/Fnr family transcriptional regulator [Devosia sp.]